MKKVFALLTAVALMFSIAACSGTSYKDGTYTAEAADFESSGWKDNVTVTIKDGKISAVNWNSTYKDDTRSDKKTEAANGTYGMKNSSGIGKEWDEQAKVVEDLLVENQDPDKIKFNSDGYADGISGCTIHVNGFVTLAKEALEKAK